MSGWNRLNSLAFAAAPLAAVLLAAMPTQAAIVAESLPYPTTNDWTRGAMNAGNTGNDGSHTFLETSPYSGNWFGWGQYYANTPSWTPGDDSAGNLLSLTARFGANGDYGGPRDWSAYFYDGSHMFDIEFNPTRCSDFAYDQCYSRAAYQGVDLYFGDSSSSSGVRRQFVDLDITTDHTYDVLLKNGLVSYTIDGTSYAGEAYAVPLYKLLVVGDSSAPTPTGAGTMTISAVSFDNAPIENVVLAAVPEPATWATMIGGFVLIGASARRSRRIVARHRIG